VHGHARQLETIQSTARPLTRREARALADGPAHPRLDASAEPRVRRLARKLLPVGALGLSAALIVSVTVPASALTPLFEPTAPVTSNVAAAQFEAGAQSMEVAEVEAVQAERGDYKIVTKPKPKPKPSPARYAVASSAPGASGASAPTVAPSGAVRWPVDGLKVSDGFGYRVSPCAGCSSNHMGTDFTPGNGSPVYAIAAGTVSVVASSGGYGTHVYVDHTINGQSVRSLYAHLQGGSAAVSVGQQVSAGTYLGAVGMTGSATGPHLHHEILVNGVNVDPYAWLAANVG
jgi:murein DD-endopeptidase MepM/ murein hydrolase activator NlpD